MVPERCSRDLGCSWLTGNALRLRYLDLDHPGTGFTMIQNRFPMLSLYAACRKTRETAHRYSRAPQEGMVSLHELEIIAKHA